MNQNTPIPAAQLTTDTQGEAAHWKRLQLKPDQFAMYGMVNECLPNTMFRVQITESDIPELVGREMLCTLTGKMRLNRIRILPGDKVQGYVTKYDLLNGKITFRVK